MPGLGERIGLRSRAADRTRAVESSAFLLLLYI